MYADKEYYLNTYKGNIIDETNIQKALEQASRHIDSLTFNRIVKNGFDNLTTFQQGIIKSCACMLAEFETENKEIINNVLTNYSINGVSMSFTGESVNFTVENGIAVTREIYSFLKQTGLCCKSLRW